MLDVFICCSQEDISIAEAVCHKFEESGIRCWYAQRDVKRDQDRASATIAAIEEVKVMVLVFTEFSNSSEQVCRDVDTAVDSGKTIIPFKCTEINPT